MSTSAQMAANKQNAQLSTGPVTPEGKARSSHNAVKSALTGQTILLPSDDAAAYTALIERLTKKFAPATDDERHLVQAIADTEWRLARIPSLEAGILAVGRLELADIYPEITDPATRALCIEGKIQTTYRRDLSNLALQESRLLRRRKLDTESLQKLQESRKEAEAKGLEEAAALYAEALRTGEAFVPEQFGFEFSLAEIKQYSARQALKNTRGVTPAAKTQAAA